MINREFANSIKRLMPESPIKVDPDKPVSLWKELDRLRGFPEQSTVAIFRTRGCSWYNFSSCSMCGYFNDISNEINSENLMRQIEHIMSSLSGSKVLKVFTSGSFLDPREIPHEVRTYLFDSLEGKVEKVLIESRSEYIYRKNLQDVQKYDIDKRVAIGLESANDNVIGTSINKGSTFSKFVSAAELLNSMGMELRTYLLFKPPFLSEIQSIEDSLESIRLVSQYTTDVSVNPMNIQRHTMVENLWKKGLYRPPRLWSLARILLESRSYGTEVVSYPTGGNKERGIHNDESNMELLNLIVEASLSQDFSALQEYYSAKDKEEYINDLNLEHVNLLQYDYLKLVSRISSSSVSL